MSAIFAKYKNKAYAIMVLNNFEFLNLAIEMNIERRKWCFEHKESLIKM